MTPYEDARQDERWRDAQKRYVAEYKNADDALVARLQAAQDMAAVEKEYEK